VNKATNATISASTTAPANAVPRRAAKAPSGAWCRPAGRRFFAQCASA